jgi:hydrogenase nickel incorporation protein HypB
MSRTEIRVYRDLMGENEKWAAETRRLLAATRTGMLNVIGSPGCGKTALLEWIGRRLAGGKRMAVLEGDVETTRDAERLAALGITASQLLTGGACHLEAKLVHRALADLPLGALDLVIVENVGNLVCPAEFDIGERAKVAVLSVTEGEDKPLKYPLLFREASAVVLTKTDLLPHLDYDLDGCLQAIRQVHDGAPVYRVSARTGEGMEECLQGLIGLCGETTHGGL